VRRASLVLLAVVVAALGIAGFATANRLGVLQTGGSVANEPLDPQALPGGSEATPFPSGLCPPQAEPAGASGSDAELSGACAFHQAGQVYCRAALDDFYVLVRRLLPDGGTLDLYMDVETYAGPRAYRNVQVLLLVQDGPTLYQWSNFRADGTVTARETSFELPSTQLRPETGRAGSGEETVAGTFACGGAAP